MRERFLERHAPNAGIDHQNSAPGNACRRVELCATIKREASMTTIIESRSSRQEHRNAITLTELLCVIAVIAILLAFYLPAIARAYLRVKKFLTGM